jgi:hypothetical protein
LRARTRSWCGFGPGRGDPSVMVRNPAWQEASTMEPGPARPRHEAIDQDDLVVHEWRVTQLTRLGIPCRWPRPRPVTSTGTRSPGWCAAAARRGLRSRSSGEAAHASGSAWS